MVVWQTASKHFNKKKSGYYNKSKNKVHNVLCNLVKELGMKYDYIQKNIYTNENNKSYIKTHMFYTIKNI